MRTYEEICEDLKTAVPGPEARKLHKELKAYGDGLSLFDRYPCIMYLSLATAGAVLLAAIIILVVTLVMRL